MDTIKRARIGHAAILTALTVAIALLTGLTLGAAALPLVLLPMPLPLAVLWLSTDAVRSDERGAARPLARPEREVAEARAVPVAS